MSKAEVCYVAEMTDGCCRTVRADSDAMAIELASAVATVLQRTLFRVYTGESITPYIRVVWRAEDVPECPEDFERGRDHARRFFITDGGLVSIDAWESVYWLIINCGYTRQMSRSWHLGYVHQARAMWREAHGIIKVD